MKPAPLPALYLLIISLRIFPCSWWKSSVIGLCWVCSILDGNRLLPQMMAREAEFAATRGKVVDVCTISYGNSGNSLPYIQISGTMENGLVPTKEYNIPIAEL